ncbi:hypothetical protein PROFUN_11694 [Planoprotostelium fungivorum]|uniref:Uncharacterized protein n=1 Tax=Planoprotostelium fungivorum TaxID=1890364 RepID=A0A2P6N5C3_9EUKA|nr:hypothetical protein PROFUN_11694 [Planoprotostelium fungivorum]
MQEVSFMIFMREETIERLNVIGVVLMEESGYPTHLTASMKALSKVLPSNIRLQAGDDEKYTVRPLTTMRNRLLLHS